MVEKRIRSWIAIVFLDFGLFLDVKPFHRIVHNFYGNLVWKIKNSSLREKGGGGGESLFDISSNKAQSGIQFWTSKSHFV